MTPQIWYMILYFAAVVAITAGMIVVSYVLGQRHQDRATGEPYESGIVSMGSARLRFSAKFYLVAMFFVIFDLESVFLFSWAVASRELGWRGYIAALIFIAVLMAVLVYEWRMGALDWGSAGRVDRRRFRQ
jgi:NADH-quinone oxidoreductase subunit A